MNTFRVLYYEPRPGLDWHVPIAAVVQGRGGVTTVSAELLPDARCLGGEAYHALMEHARRLLIASPVFEEVPEELGDKFFLSDPQAVPEQAAERPEAWVERHVLPRVRQLTPGTKRPATPKRITLGRRFFENKGVARLVQNNFQPTQVWASDRNARHLHATSHYVQGPDRTLLLEPLAPAGAKLENQVRDVVARFASYKVYLSPELQPRFPRIAYLLSGAVRSEDRRELRATLSHVASVYDTTENQESEALIGRIRETVPQSSL